MRIAVMLLLLLTSAAVAGEWAVTINDEPVCRTAASLVVPCLDPLAATREVNASIYDENGGLVLTTTRTFPISTNGAAIKWSLRHDGWMKKYPEGAVSTEIVPGKMEQIK